MRWRQDEGRQMVDSGDDLRRASYPRNGGDVVVGGGVTLWQGVAQEVDAD